MLHSAALKRKQVEPTANSLQSLRRIGGFGLMMGVLIMAGFYLGSYIDRHLETYPVFMLLLVILAIIGGFIQLFRNAGFLGGEK
jgi:F0F1-type ATP synthase assembly protein I